MLISIRQGSDAGFLFVSAFLDNSPSSVGSYPGATLAGTQAEFTVEDFYFMVEVPLTQGYVALIDDEDAERVLAFSWRVRICSNGKRYARRNVTCAPNKRKDESLHRFILNAPDGAQVDHRDNNGLNCQKHNLRLATVSQNQQNRHVQRNRLGLKGVEFHPNSRGKQFSSRIKLNGRSTFLGYYHTVEDAARAYDAKAKELFGEYAAINFPEEGER